MMLAADISRGELGDRIARALLIGFSCVGLAACQQIGGSPGSEAAVQTPPPPAAATLSATGQDPADVKYFRSDEPLRLGLQRFNDGSYGLAEQYFRDAVEKAPKDASAWIGLAASYDRLARFDLADRAYRQAVKISGQTTQILNNEGYSYMLRGDLKKARAAFQLALARDPENQTIANNMILLDSSWKYIERQPE
jgi:Flp pilus assembly protein TadD